MVAGTQAKDLYFSEIQVVSARKSEVDAKRTGCRTICQPIIEKLDENEVCVSVFNGQSDEDDKKQLIEVLTEAPDWANYNEDDDESKLNILGLMKYWSVSNDLGGGALWDKLPMGPDVLIPGSMLNV